MKKRYVNLILAMASASVLVLGSVPAMAKTDETKTESGEEAEASEEKDTDAAKADTLEDGVYTAEFGTDSSMFHVNEANDKKGELTVKDGKMTIHVSLVSKKIVNLFAGTAEDAQKDGAEIIEPTTDTVKYSDGYTEEVYGFDIPVPAIGEEFNVAILGEKGKWYDHKVSVKNPVKTSDGFPPLQGTYIGRYKELSAMNRHGTIARAITQSIRTQQKTQGSGHRPV